MIEGNFIVLEGIDGAGTTTQANLLCEAFVNRGLPAHVTREPSEGPIGHLIRQILTGRLVVPGSGGSHSPGWATMAALFAADRLDHLEAEVMPNLRDGVTVICDRYDYSSVAYQSLSAGDAEGALLWVRELNLQARRPDLTIILDVDAQVAADRRGSRQGAPELYEDRKLQDELGVFYATIDKYFPNDQIVHVNANASKDAVMNEIDRIVREFRGDAKP